MSTERHIILPSNASNDVFPNNRADDYTTLLNDPIELEQGNYQVALQEFQFIRALPTVSTPSFTVATGTLIRRAYTVITLQRTNFGTINAFVEHINQRINSFAQFKNKVSFTYNALTSRVTITLSPGFITSIPPEWVSILGFTGQRVLITTTGAKPADLYKGIYNLYIYTDISTPIRIGSVSKQLLGIVSIPKGQRDIPEVVTKTFTNPMYVNTIGDRIETIRIYIKDDHGNAVQFKIEPVIVRLSIREAP